MIMHSPAATRCVFVCIFESVGASAVVVVVVESAAAVCLHRPEFLVASPPVELLLLSVSRAVAFVAAAGSAAAGAVRGDPLRDPRSDFLPPLPPPPCSFLEDATGLSAPTVTHPSPAEDILLFCGFLFVWSLSLWCKKFV